VYHLQIQSIYGHIRSEISNTVPDIRRTEDTAYIRSYGLGQPYIYAHMLTHTHTHTHTHNTHTTHTHTPTTHSCLTRRGVAADVAQLHATLEFLAETTSESSAPKPGMSQDCPETIPDGKQFYPIAAMQVCVCVVCVYVCVHLYMHVLVCVRVCMCVHVCV
jgi:hypothetical protein